MPHYVAGVFCNALLCKPFSTFHSSYAPGCKIQSKKWEDIKLFNFFCELELTNGANWKIGGVLQPARRTQNTLFFIERGIEFDWWLKFIYRIFYLAYWNAFFHHFFNHVGEIGCQHLKAPLAAAIKAISDLTQPTRPTNVGDQPLNYLDIGVRTDHHTGNYLRITGGFFHVAQAQVCTDGLWERASVRFIVFILEDQCVWPFADVITSPRPAPSPQ